MKQAVGFAFLGWIAGSIVLGILFTICVPRRGHEDGIWFAFSIMGGVPVDAVCAMLATLQAELRETRCEMKAWMMSFQLIEDKEGAALIGADIGTVPACSAARRGDGMNGCTRHAGRPGVERWQHTQALNTLDFARGSKCAVGKKNSE